MSDEMEACNCVKVECAKYGCIYKPTRRYEKIAMSERKIVEYKIECIAAVHSSISLACGAMLLKGDWQPLGGPFVRDSSVYQAMVRYE